MASTLSVQISESLVLNGKEEGSIRTQTYTGITDSFRRTVTLPAATDPNTLVDLSDIPVTSTFGKLDEDSVAYVRVTNLSSNTVGLALNGATTAIAFSLTPGKSQIFNNSLMQGDDTAGSINATPTIKINSIEAWGVVASTSQLEVFVALSLPSS